MSKIEVEKAVVSSENYKEVMALLVSDDEASVKVGMSIMEQSDFEKSQIYIMCGLKDAFDKIFKSQEEFSTQYPVLHEKVTKKLYEAETDMATLSFKGIYEIAVSRKNEEEINFVLQFFTDELTRLLKDYGFTFLEFLDIHVKPKVDGTTA